MFQPIIKTLWTLLPCLCFSQKRIEKSVKRKIRSTDIPLKIISLNFQCVLRSLSTLNMSVSLTHWRSMAKVLSMGLEIIFEFFIYYGGKVPPCKQSLFYLFLLYLFLHGTKHMYRKRGSACRVENWAGQNFLNPVMINLDMYTSYFVSLIYI